MKKLIMLMSIMFTVESSLLISAALSWNDEITHKSLTNYAADKSVLSAGNDDYLINIGFSDSLSEILKWPGKVCDEKTGETACSVKDWLRYGAEKEDAKIDLISGRFNNHFHEPISDTGIDDYADIHIPPIPPRHVTGQSSMLWAQDAESQETYPQGDRSRPGLRILYYIALTHESAA